MQYDSGGTDAAQDVFVHSSGSIYVSGNTRGAFTGTNKGNADYFIAKLSSSGTSPSYIQNGGSGNDLGRAIAVDSNNKIFLVSQTNAELFSVNGLGSLDYFYAAYSSSMSLSWGIHDGTSGLDFGTSVVVDASDNIFIAGTTGGAGRFGSYYVGSYMAFVAKINPANGNVIWGTPYGGSAADNVDNICLDSNGSFL
eukprot:gene1440-1042_t